MEIPAVWLIGGLLVAVGVFFVIKKVGPWYIDSLETFSGVDFPEFCRQLLAGVCWLSGMVAFVVALFCVVDGACNIGVAVAMAERDIACKKTELPLEDRIAEIEHDSYVKMGMGVSFLVGAALLGWTGVVFNQYSRVERRR